MEENTNNMPTPETISHRNLRRRTRYAQMSPQRKQLLLSQLREKRAESKRQKNLRQSNSTAALTISTFSLSPEQASQNTNVPSNSPTGEHIVSLLSTSELEFKSRLSLYDQETAKYRAADVSIIQKMVEDLTMEDDDVVQVNGKAFAVDGHLQEKQLSTPTAPSFHSIHMQLEIEVLYQQMK
ncbi:hypothetical protein H5410_038097, partial [Solanum commersonii]